MDFSEIKRYAVQARRDFIEAVSLRASKFGVTKDQITDYQIKGELLVIGADAYPRDLKSSIDDLREAVRLLGFDSAIENFAYTWFNRFVALRYMELQGYLDVRVLSSGSEHPHPDIMQNISSLHFDAPYRQAQALKLYEAGKQDEELYRYLLIAQCNQLNKVMPFLFEKVSDVSELLLPDNLLATDSIIRKLVSEIDEDLWRQGVEIIGWIYQYYISEKKDEVIGKVVKSEDIPAATQLFTPNWIVKYLVQNSLGSYWLSTYPDSGLKQKMEYYITPAKQTSEVEAELAKITPKEIDPETITVLDPAAGSGHILVEAYNLLKEIYSERGYHPRDIPRLILEKNLYGLDIDARAAQLAGLALLMRARGDDRNILNAQAPVKLNILEIKGVDFKIDEAVQTLTKGKTLKIEQMAMPFVEQPKQMEMKLKAADSLTPQDLKEFIELFEEAKTFGSLITVPEEIKSRLPAIEKLTEQIIDEAFRRGGNALERVYALKLQVLLRQAKVLAGQYDVIVANPPYMGSKFFDDSLRNFVKCNYEEVKSDLFACFLIRFLHFASPYSYIAPVTLEAWMFLSSYEGLRQQLLKRTALLTLTHMPYQGHSPTPMRINFGTVAFAAVTHSISRYIGRFNCLRYFELDEDGFPPVFPVSNERLKDCPIDKFGMIPTSPIAYWVSDRFRLAFTEGTPLGEVAAPRQGMATSDNNRFLRRWYEVSLEKVGFNFCDKHSSADSGKKWFPYNKGGEFRKWYGNQEFLINWEHDGKEVMGLASQMYGSPTRTIKNIQYYFRECASWSKVTSSKFSVRYFPPGFLFDVAGSSIYTDTTQQIHEVMALLNSQVVASILSALSPTLNYEAEHIKAIPVLHGTNGKVAKEAIEIARNDWDLHEVSWNFGRLPIVSAGIKESTISESFVAFKVLCNSRLIKMQELECENNRFFIQAYGMESELSPEVSESEITLYRPERTDDIEALLSYSIGCMMGRYSLDEAGLTYANSGNIGFDFSRYKKFPADEDGILPLMDSAWFEDDATARFLSFLRVVWGEDTFDENIKFVADSLSPKDGETPQETIQRYFSDSFFRDHLKTYKKRPIYWLFSSGKEGAFQALVYLHRYNESTLSKMRTDYVLKLQAKMNSEDRKLNADIEAAHSTAERTKLRKALEKLHKKQEELRKFDEVLHHYADQRVALDLDDGVKVNYGKLAPLLAEVKQVTGGSEE